MKQRTLKANVSTKLADLCEQIRTASTAELKAGSHNKLVEQAILLASQEDNYCAVQQVAFALFPGRQYMYSQHHRLLELMLIAAAREAVLGELNKNGLTLSHKSLMAVLQSAWQEWQEKFSLQDQDDHEAKPQPYNGIYKTGDDEQLITVTCGGGHFYIQLFLDGKSKGYALDHYKGTFPGYGVYVCPGANNPMVGRAPAYAVRGASRSCDIPVIMTAQIPVKYLVATPNSTYECGLPAEHVDKLQNISMKPNSYDCFSLKDCVGEIEIIFDETLNVYDDEIREELQSVYLFALPPLKGLHF